MKNKICNTCGILKPLEEYSKRSASPDGYQQKCKNCNKVDNAKYRQTYPLYKKEPEKRKKLIKLICTVKGEKYIEEKEIGQVKITAQDIKLLEEKVLGININVKL